MVIAIGVREYTECKVVAIVYNGNEDISMCFCNVMAFLMVPNG